MSWRNVGVVYRKELTDSLRDRRTVISMVVVPILLMPLLTLAVGLLSARLIGHAITDTPRIMLLGGQDSPKVLAALRQMKGVEIAPEQADYVQEILDRRIRAAAELPADFDARLERGEEAEVRIYMYDGDLRSGLGADKLQRFFRDFRDQTVHERLQARQLPANLSQPFLIEQQNVAPPEKVGGSLLGGLLPYFVIILSLTGTMHPAMDLTVGEKERGTIETILCSPVSRTQLVLGKFLMVLTASLAAVVLSMASMGMTFGIGKSLAGGMDPESNAALQMTFGVKAMTWVFLMMVPLAVFFSAALLAISLFAKSYKEAQSYLSPLTIVVMLPAVISLLPGVELDGRLALVPILNTSLVSKEIVSGTYHWGYIFLIFASSCIYAAGALWVAVRLFQREDVLFRS